MVEFVVYIFVWKILTFITVALFISFRVEVVKIFCCENVCCSVKMVVYYDVKITENVNFFLAIQFELLQMPAVFHSPNETQ